ncbi:aspartyl-phosphate phosphatase Spo0E family protein [Fictibacillus aquaticus]|uniref:Spo0E family sporulation regulatory protein-aspartic acid phosphatase n=1 Tax=Fictibacillus aquaticus TaxID=2021314 RepID=A0A235F8D5_9BACL|nr:aspartyl-phosphate phosphatase Spo0E family protein [Fictibacillus aquaticus]OYD57570.1 hypothetical protein CGZ90_12945 [Fictibacillus aquaticus]
MKEQDLFQLIAIKRKELYQLYNIAKEMTDSRVVALSQELDSLILKSQNQQFAQLAAK